jgi:hypothetical protein
MHIDDDFAWGNRDRSWSVRLEEALWLDRNERWEEARQALRGLAAEAEDHQDKAAALLALAELLHSHQQSDLLAIADEVIGLITIAPDKMWTDGPHRLLMRGHMMKAKALFWAEDFEGAMHSLCRALSCMSDSKRDAQAVHQLAIALSEHAEYSRWCKDRARRENEQNELRELWACRNGHFDPWVCLQDIYCPGPCSCGIEKWLRRKLDCPGNHVGPWNCPDPWNSDSACPGAQNPLDPDWESIREAVDLFNIDYCSRWNFQAPARARCTKVHRSDWELANDYGFDGGLDQTMQSPNDGTL